MRRWSRWHWCIRPTSVMLDGAGNRQQMTRYRYPSKLPRHGTNFTWLHYQTNTTIVILISIAWKRDSCSGQQFTGSRWIYTTTNRINIVVSWPLPEDLYILPLLRNAKEFELYVQDLAGPTREKSDGQSALYDLQQIATVGNMPKACNMHRSV